MTESWSDFLGLDRAAVGHGLRLALAAWLALAIAVGLHIANPYWAAMPIWVVTQATRGLLLERAVFRVLGTLIGAAAGFGFMRLTGNPWALFALLGLWVAVAAGLTHLLRGVHAYAALLAGMTAAIVVLPTLLAPASSAALGLARVECTLIGVCVVTAVTGLFTPDSARADFYRRARDLAADAVDFAATMAGGAELAPHAASERRILAEITEIDAAAALVSAGSIEGYRRLHDVTALAVSSLAVMAAGRALRGRRLRGGALPEGIEARLRADAVHLRRGGGELGVPAGVAAGVAAAWAAEDAAPALRRLHDALTRLLAAAAALAAEPVAADARSFGSKAVYLAPHRDWRLARRTGVVAGGGTLLAAVAGYLSGWPAGELTALGVCIFSMVLSTQPVPRTAAAKLLGGMLAGIAVATAYRFLVQPRIDGFLPLMVSVAPVLVVGGLARAGRRTAIPAIDFNMGFLLAGQIGMGAAGAAAILGGSAALGLAAGVVCLGFILMPTPPYRRAMAAAEAIRRDLARLIARREPTGPARWHPRTAREILRLTLQLSRAGALLPEEGRAEAGGAGASRKTADRSPPAFGAPGGILAALSFGHAIGDLQDAAADPALDQPSRASARAALATLHRFAADPQGIAQALAAQARGVADGDTRAAIEDAAGALAAGAALFAFGLADR